MGSHNVTEDADLGLRLYAHGYRTGIIKNATVESSPVQLGVWIRQRTRWLKGWAQTWLVVMRRPAATFASLGPAGFCHVPADDCGHARFSTRTPTDVRVYRA
jgi:ribosome modulation factor